MTFRRRYASCGLARRPGSRWNAGGDSPPASPLTLSPTVYLRQDGITEVSGDVASWDDEGSAGLRFEPPSVPARPALVTVGNLVGAQCLTTGSYLVSDAAAQLVKPAIIWCCLRADQWIANDRVFDFDASSFIASVDVSGDNGYRWEQGASDPTTSGVDVQDGDVLQILIKLAANGGTSSIRINAVERGTAAANAATPASRTVGIGARNDGIGPSNLTFIEGAVWNGFADNDAMNAFDIDAVEAWGAYLISQAT